MRIISDDYYLSLGLREALKVHEIGLQDMTISLSSDLKTIRLYKDISVYSNEKFFVGNCLTTFVMSYQLDDGLTPLHHKLYRLIAERKTMYLTPREIDVLKDLLDGQNILEISRNSGLSPKTISAQKNSGLKKLKVSNLHMLHRDISSFRNLFYGKQRSHAGMGF
ncbi:helix-turn-helix domain-containing protein [Pantoea phytobeneficialis]|uniref:DNA-binding response regulator n=2 Tax=Pantoea TaxID=53335 RepID=A0AAP9HA84_9GAMM|nr:LuxR C-terminal-related transcriptional regulator [Pantoea phytobeneficialis]MDO6407410.1 LuxR C-terminal-related transcriptional regulator [Pantoea phytobeneficialis]QGR09543.1 DNA-binding response regulator [Pantoea phytobeneficialis]